MPKLSARGRRERRRAVASRTAGKAFIFNGGAGIALLKRIRRRRNGKLEIVKRPGSARNARAVLPFSPRKENFSTDDLQGLRLDRRSGFFRVVETKRKEYSDHLFDKANEAAKTTVVVDIIWNSVALNFQNKRKLFCLEGGKMYSLMLGMRAERLLLGTFLSSEAQ